MRPTTQCTCRVSRDCSSPSTLSNGSVDVFVFQQRVHHRGKSCPVHDGNLVCSLCNTQQHPLTDMHINCTEKLCKECRLCTNSTGTPIKRYTHSRIGKPCTVCHMSYIVPTHRELNPLHVPTTLQFSPNAVILRCESVEGPPTLEYENNNR